jgi:hypothetical protein
MLARYTHHKLSHFFTQGSLRVTVQGEIIEQQFGEREVCFRALDLYTSAVLEACLDPPPAPKKVCKSCVWMCSSVYVCARKSCARMFMHMRVLMCLCASMWNCVSMLSFASMLQTAHNDLKIRLLVECDHTQMYSIQHTYGACLSLYK